VKHRNGDNALPVGDWRWEAMTRSLLAHVRVSGFISIDEIVEWGRRSKYTGYEIRDMLAWLSFNNLVVYDEQVQAWKAAQIEQSEERRDEAVQGAR
jgi:hypothetical protein